MLIVMMMKMISKPVDRISEVFEPFSVHGTVLVVWYPSRVGQGGITEKDADILCQPNLANLPVCIIGK